MGEYHVFFVHDYESFCKTKFKNKEECEKWITRFYEDYENDDGAYITGVVEGRLLKFEPTEVKTRYVLKG